MPDHLDQKTQIELIQQDIKYIHLDIKETKDDIKEIKTDIKSLSAIANTISDHDRRINELFTTVANINRAVISLQDPVKKHDRIFTWLEKWLWAVIIAVTLGLGSSAWLVIRYFISKGIL